LVRPSIGWTAGAWFAICAALAAIVAYQLVNSFPLAPTVTAAPPSAPLLELAERPEPPRSPGDDAVEDIAARPLFSADRRPYVPPPEPVEQVVAKVESSLPLELAGTFLTATDQAALILVAGKSPEWLRSGQSIEGWQIGTIEQDRVHLLKGEQQRELQLREDGSAPQPSVNASTRRARSDSKRQPDPEQKSLRDLALEVDEEDSPPAEDDEPVE
jgi:hypothetical protein